MVNNDPIQQKDIFDERQIIVRSQITVRALWFFAIAAFVNIIVMECGPQWCESYVISTLIFGAAAYLYWVCANARRGSLFGVNGVSNLTMAAGMLFVDGVLIPFSFMDRDPDFFKNFFFRNGMVSDNFAAALSGLFVIAASVVMTVCAVRYNKAKKAEKSDNS